MAVAAQEPRAEPAPAAQDAFDAVDPEPELDTEDAIDRVLSRPMRDQVYSVQLGKLASRSRLLNSSAAKAVPTKRTLSMAIKNMPKNVTRQVSKSGPSPRSRPRKTRPGATPWSLGL